MTGNGVFGPRGVMNWTRAACRRVLVGSPVGVDEWRQVEYFAGVWIPETTVEVVRVMHG